MSSKQKRKIAQQNGAKAAGSKSPQGIQRSSQNALVHGLTSRTLVLSNEVPEKFNLLMQSYVEKFRPQDGVEMNLVNEMVAARWRQQRIWLIQTAAIELQMELHEEQPDNPNAGVGEAYRISLAFTAMANNEKNLDMLIRYETAFSRMHDRAMKALHRLREEQNLQNDPTEPEAEEEIVKPPNPNQTSNQNKPEQPKPMEGGRPRPRGGPCLQPPQPEINPLS